MVEVEGAGHTSCTVEMCALHVPVDVAVLDEIQMISHPERGWAWSRALLGLPSSEFKESIVEPKAVMNLAELTDDKSGMSI